MKQLSVKSGKQLCLRWLLKAMVILQFLAIIFFNYTKAYDFLDMDSAGALRHGAEMLQIASPNGHLCHIRRPLRDLIGGQLGTH